MARKAQKSKKAKRVKTGTPQQSNAAKNMSRRGLLQMGVLGGAVILGGGYFGIRSVRASIGETDLSKIGQGVPAVVQIHDPNCPICNALQREARKAINDMDGDKPEYLVANIKTVEGSNFAADHGVPHVTLLTFNAKGELQDVLRGSRKHAELRPVFEDLMARAPRS